MSRIIPENVKLTPMLKQYVQWKEKHPDCLLFFRMGDFYELFFEDAKIASEILDITLTARDPAKKMPMAGVPHHAVDSYLAKAIKKGYKVAICEQVSEPDGKTLVKREVTRIVTPGTYVPEDSDQDGRLMGIHRCKGNRWAIAFLSPATGVFEAGLMSLSEAIALVSSFQGAEALISKKARVPDMNPLLASISVIELPDREFDPQDGTDWLCRKFDVLSLGGYGIDDESPQSGVAAALLRYLEETQFRSAKYVNKIQPIKTSLYLHLDLTTQDNLEIIDGSTSSLYSVLNRCKTIAGKRTLRNWLLRPMMDLEVIKGRQEVQKILVEKPLELESIQDSLCCCRDIERSVARLHLKTGTPRDLSAIRDTLISLPQIKDKLESTDLSFLLPECPDLIELGHKLDSAIVESPSRMIPGGLVIRAGYDSKLDHWRDFAKEGKCWCNEFIERERERLGVSKLKIGYNRVFGYYIEISKSALKDGIQIPEDYHRRQTLVSAERFISPELKEFEQRALSSDEEIKTREMELYRCLLEETLNYTEVLQNVGRAVGKLDVLVSLSHVARERSYVCPEVNDSVDISIHGGRHPVLEVLHTEKPFVPNDVKLYADRERVDIITGPNMAGKSTYLRMAALLVIMAQMGSFIPAEKAVIGLCDRVFTRLGARDEISRGNSTFMVEMVETANILNNVTDRSLVILDEVGRGTSTYDGMSIAWAVLEYLHTYCGSRPKVLFATHYHELTELEERLDCSRNLSMAVEETADGVAFLHRVVSGPADRSYGIEVGKLAGLPRVVLQRARELLSRFEKEKNVASSLPGPSPQIELFDLKGESLLHELSSLSLDDMTPIQALKELYKLKEKAIKVVNT